MNRKQEEEWEKGENKRYCDQQDKCVVKQGLKQVQTLYLILFSFYFRALKLVCGGYLTILI